MNILKITPIKVGMNNMARRAPAARSALCGLLKQLAFHLGPSYGALDMTAQNLNQVEYSPQEEKILWGQVENAGLE